MKATNQARYFCTVDVCMSPGVAPSKGWIEYASFSGEFGESEQRDAEEQAKDFFGGAYRVSLASWSKIE